MPHLLKRPQGTHKQGKYDVELYFMVHVCMLMGYGVSFCLGVNSVTKDISQPTNIWWFVVLTFILDQAELFILT